jgi:hypothetical protein
VRYLWPNGRDRTRLFQADRPQFLIAKRKVHLAAKNPMNRYLTLRRTTDTRHYNRTLRTKEMDRLDTQNDTQAHLSPADPALACTTTY